jgi:hypothetical protein
VCFPETLKGRKYFEKLVDLIIGSLIMYKFVKSDTVFETLV